MSYQKKLEEFDAWLKNLGPDGFKILWERYEKEVLKEQEEEKARMAEIHQCAYNKIKDHLDRLTDEEFLEEWDAIEADKDE